MAFDPVITQNVEDQMLAETYARAAAYQVLDQVLANNCVAPGVRGAMFCAIDSMRSMAAPAEDVRRAEAVSIGIQKFEWARQRGDVTASNAAIDELKALAAEWLNRASAVLADVYRRLSHNGSPWHQSRQW